MIKKGIMPFGRYKSKKLETVPKDYIKNLLDFYKKDLDSDDKSVFHFTYQM